MARCFEKEVDKKYLDDVVKFSPLLKRISESTEDKIFIKGVEALEQCTTLISADAKQDDIIEDLACKYATLFLNAGAGDAIEHVSSTKSAVNFYFANRGHYQIVMT